MFNYEGTLAGNTSATTHVCGAGKDRGLGSFSAAGTLEVSGEVFLKGNVVDIECRNGPRWLRLGDAVIG
jgi:hypothetical protein